MFRDVLVDAAFISGCIILYLHRIVALEEKPRMPWSLSHPTSELHHHTGRRPMLKEFKMFEDLMMKDNPKMLSLQFPCTTLLHH